MSLINRGDIDRTIYKTAGIDVFRSAEILGYNPSIGTTFEDIWPIGGVRIWPQTAVQLDIVSDSANDTAAGTGAREIVVIGSDGNVLPVVELVPLNGTTLVQTTKLFKRVDIVRVTKSGTFNTTVTGPADGTITVSSSGDVQAVITESLDGVSSGQQSGMYGTMLNGTTGYMDSLLATVNPKRDISMNVFIRNSVEPGGGDFNPRIQLLQLFLPEGTTGLIFPTPVVFPEFSDVWMAAAAASGTVEVSVAAEVRVVTNA